jgi:hypothetical protein
MQAVGLSIKTKKVVYRGIKAYKVVGFSCYEEANLPFEYFDEYPYCIEYKGDLVIITNDKSFKNGGCAISVGDIILTDDFDKIMSVLRYCGKKLHDINEHVKQAEAEWKGEEEFVI